MARKTAKGPTLVIGGAIALCAIALVALIANFSEVSLGQTWPVLLMALAGCLALAGFWELGLGLFGFFSIWLLSNLEVIPEFSKSWPFTLIWIVIVVVIAFMRSRSRSGQGAG